ncbi:MAG: hypothetical protein A2W17_03500 [Planctomycetes bacterium RBG_16_41_13]|nr:MAG: hypothetical protein A2W17_03500 [Planctomycetes bacterium RBG_16_41_13]
MYGFDVSNYLLPAHLRICVRFVFMAIPADPDSIHGVKADIPALAFGEDVMPCIGILTAENAGLIS